MNLLISFPSIDHVIAVGIVLVLGLLALHVWADHDQKEDDIDDPTENMYL